MKFKVEHRCTPGWQVWTIRLVCLGFLVVSGKYVSASNSTFEESAENAINISFIPVALSNYPKKLTFGIQSKHLLLMESELLDRGVKLGASWARLSDRISWSKLQPNPEDAIDWTQLAQFEKELIALKEAGITPVIPVQRYPHWAVKGDAWFGQPTSCGPLREDTFDEFAEFMQAVVNRYKTPEFNVHDWELGNEPDVDPELLPIDHMFGCWGNIDDPFYGGRHYGEMIKVVSSAIKQADPTATVWLGGLLLGSLGTTDPNYGKPELFLKGVLEAGAAPYFDVVGYHWYSYYYNVVADYDINWGQWADWGGGTVGKARFLRQTMDEYGVKKRIVLNETALMCAEFMDFCDPLPAPSFYEMQADHLVRSFVRGLSVNVEGFIWYTLDGPGYRHIGLLDENDDPHEAYFAHQNLVLQLKNSQYTSIVNHSPGVEAYAFQRGTEIVQVVWTQADEVVPITFPGSQFIAAYDRTGNPIVPTPVGDNFQIDIRFTPIFLVLNP